MPFPRLLTTPPVTKTYLVMSLGNWIVAVGAPSSARGHGVRVGDRPAPAARRRGLAAPLALGAMPPSMRASSASRSSPSTRRTAAAVAVALDDEVGVGEGGHLGEVGDHQHLAARGEPGEPASPHRQRGGSADSGVDLVEGDHRGVGDPAGEADGQHQSAQLAARRPPGRPDPGSSPSSEANEQARSDRPHGVRGLPATSTTIEHRVAESQFPQVIECAVGQSPCRRGGAPRPGRHRPPAALASGGGRVRRRSSRHGVQRMPSCSARSAAAVAEGDHLVDGGRRTCAAGRRAAAARSSATAEGRRVVIDVRRRCRAGRRPARRPRRWRRSSRAPKVARAIGSSVACRPDAIRGPRRSRSAAPLLVARGCSWPPPSGFGDLLGVAQPARAWPRSSSSSPGCEAGRLDLAAWWRARSSSRSSARRSPPSCLAIRHEGRSSRSQAVAVVRPARSTPAASSSPSTSRRTERLPAQGDVLVLATISTIASRRSASALAGTIAPSR